VRQLHPERVGHLGVDLEGVPEAELQQDIRGALRRIYFTAGGELTARIGARRTMLICDASRAILFTAIPTLHLMGMLSFAGLVGLVFLVGVFMVPHASAQRVIVPELVGEDAGRVGETQSLLQVGMAISGIAGPALGGVLIAVLGETNVLYFDAASYAVSFVLLGIWVRPAKAVVDDSNEPRGVLDGVRFLFRDRLLRTWMLSITGINVVWSALGVAMPVLVLERYGDRIQLFHVKDMAAGPFPGPIEIVGEGIIDFPEVFAASKRDDEFRAFCDAEGEGRGVEGVDLQRLFGVGEGRAQAGLLFAGVLVPPERTTEVSLARVVAARMASAMRGA
jgi:MFS family permease